MATPNKLPHPAPGSRGASIAGDSGMEHANLAVGLGNPGVIMTSEVDSCDCSVIRKGQPVPPDFEIVPIDCHTKATTCADAETFDCQSSSFCLMDAHNTCYGKQANGTGNHTVGAAGFEASANIAKTKLADGCWLDADVNVFGANGSQLQAQDKDQLAEVKGALMVDSCECSVIRKGQPVRPDSEIVPIDCYTKVTTCADAETFDCQSSAFCFMDAHNTCYAEQVNGTENHTVGLAGFEASADIVKTKLADGCCLNADFTVFGADGRQLQALEKDQLAEVKGALMVDSSECSVTRNGQPFPSHHEIMSTDRHTRAMTYAAGETFYCHEQSSAFWLTDAHNTLYAKQVNETEEHNVAAGFEATADIDITKTKLTGGYWLNADVTDFGATGNPLEAPDKNQLAEGIGAVMENAQHEKICPGKNFSSLKLYSMMKVKYVDPCMIYARQMVEMVGKVARVKQPVASLELSSDSGISAYSMHVTKSMSPLRRVGQVSLFLLVVFLSASQVSSSAEAKRESAEIGSCRFDLMSLATLSCVEPDGSWRPPSISCCNALLQAIDHLPASNESGACCLCRYMSKKYRHFALATSYVLCKGKDKSIVTTWSSVPLHCHMACHRRNASSHGLDTTAAVLGTHSKDFRVPWISALVVAAFCAIFLACFCYHRRYKAIPTGESQALNLQRRGSPSEVRDGRKPPGRHSSAQRRMSSRGSPNG